MRQDGFWQILSSMDAAGVDLAAGVFSDARDHIRKVGRRLFRTDRAVSDEDVLQDALIRGRCTRVNDLGIHLRKLAKWQCIDTSRLALADKRLGRVQVVSIDHSSEEEGELQVAGREPGPGAAQWLDLREALDRLPAMEKAILIAHHYEGLTLNELLRDPRFGSCSRSALGRRLQRAIALMRGFLAAAE